MITKTDDGRPYRLIRVAALAAFIFGIFWLGLVLVFPVPDLERASRQAAELQSIVRQKPQFSAVEVTSLTSGKLFISAPDSLPLSSKADLERLISQRGSTGAMTVSYFVTIPGDSGSTNPK